jgi:hypothetical protein
LKTDIREGEETAARGRAASQMGRFETAWLTRLESLAALADQGCWDQCQTLATAGSDWVIPVQRSQNAGATSTALICHGPRFRCRLGSNADEEITSWRARPGRGARVGGPPHPHPVPNYGATCLRHHCATIAENESNVWFVRTGRRAGNDVSTPHLRSIIDHLCGLNRGILTAHADDLLAERHSATGYRAGGKPVRQPASQRRVAGRGGRAPARHEPAITHSAPGG